MNEKTLRELLEDVRQGRCDTDEAVRRMRLLPFESVGFATLDHHRSLRCGFPEVIFCPGKTGQQVREIFLRLAAAGSNVLATRASAETYRSVASELPSAEYHELARAITLRQGEHVDPVGHIAIVSAGTSDLPIAEEARVTAEILDQNVTCHYDVGVAGIHRLLAHGEKLQAANAIVVVAGMEGALASVVGGLVAVPVLAVPTSVGYGASFGGLAALLAMLNSCASNVSVVNIDNGFGAGYIASLINRNAKAEPGTRNREPGRQ
jgi:hypothetical protein